MNTTATIALSLWIPIFTGQAEAASQGQAAQPTSGPKTPKASATNSGEKVTLLIQQLASPTWRVRQNAASKLMAYGPAVYDELVQAYGAARKLEVKLRIKEVASEIFLADRFALQTGFLGIRQKPLQYASDGNRATTAIQVVSVLRGSAAERSGFESGDIIIKVNGQGIPADPTGRAFSKMIGDFKPGAAVEMQIIRGNQQGSLTATLGARPMRHQPTEVRTAAREAWNDWWNERLHPDTDAEPTAVPDSPPSPDGPQPRSKP